MDHDDENGFGHVQVKRDEDENLYWYGILALDHRWCMEFVTKRGFIATHVAKGILLQMVPPIS